MYIAHCSIFAFPLIAHSTVLGTAALTFNVLLVLLIVGLFTGAGKKSWLKLCQLTSSFALPSSISDEREVALSEAAALENNSFRDPLTGLYNRRYFFVEFEMEWTKAARESRHLGCLMIDVDDFPLLTETGGQDCGDRLLREVAHCMGKYSLRKGHIAARIGPAEFALIVPGANLADCNEVAESIRNRVSRILLPGNGVAGPFVTVTVTVSIGGSCCIPQDRGTPAGMLREAGLALNEARSHGANHVWFAPADEKTEPAYQAGTHLASHDVGSAPVEEKFALTLNEAVARDSDQFASGSADHKAGPALRQAMTHHITPLWREAVEEKAGLTLEELRAHVAWIAAEDNGISLSELTGANRH